MTVETATKGGTTTRSRTRGQGGGGDGAGGAAAATASRTRATATATAADGLARAAIRPTAEQRAYEGARRKFLAEQAARRKEQAALRREGKPVSQMLWGDQCRAVAYECGLKPAQIDEVLKGYAALIGLEVGRGGPGRCKALGCLQIELAEKPATRARKGINPFTKEPMVFKARPARKVVKVRPLAALKELV